jgi:hypothetical protein
MAAKVPAHPILPSDWNDVLSRVQQTLEKAEAEAVARARALESPAPPTAADPNHEPPWRARLTEVRDRLEGLPTYAARAPQDAAEADAELQACEETIGSWLKASKTARRRLAEWVDRAVR